MAELDDPIEHAKLRQRAIEAADNAMFKYLSFFAAIHAAAITALASTDVGLPAYLATSDSSPPEAAFVVLVTTAAVMGLLCLIVGRGLHDAGIQHRESVRYASGDGTETFFDRVYGRTAGGVRKPEKILSGVARVLPRHVRIGGAVILVALFWAILLIDLVANPAPLLIDRHPGPAGAVHGAAILWGVGVLIVGTGFLAQMLLDAWLEDGDEEGQHGETTEETGRNR